MEQYLKTFLQEFAYPDDCAILLLECYRGIESDPARSEMLRELLAAYAGNKNLKFAVIEETVKQIANGFRYHEYTVWLLVWILFSKQLKNLYEQNGLDLTVWRESMKDLKTKALECKAVQGIWGTFVASWFPNFFRLKRFAFGRLQFEPAKFESDRFVCRDGTVLERGDRVLAVHIPRSEQPLSKENCDASYRAAAKFYESEFPGEKVVFTCHSWMLYPENSLLLHEKSNTRRFAGEYEIVSVYRNAPGEHPDAWRIFGIDPKGNFDLLPEDSALRRAYKAYLRSGGITGGAYGVKLLPKVLRQGKE